PCPGSSVSDERRRKRADPRVKLAGCFKLTLPHHEDAIPEPAQGSKGTLIPRAIRRELREPKRSVSLGHCRAVAPSVGMPEAPMDEDRPEPRPVCQIRGAWQVAVADAEAQSEFVENTSHRLLGSGVALADASEPC